MNLKRRSRSIYLLTGSASSCSSAAVNSVAAVVSLSANEDSSLVSSFPSVSGVSSLFAYFGFSATFLVSSLVSSASSGFSGSPFVSSDFDSSAFSVFGLSYGSTSSTGWEFLFSPAAGLAPADTVGGFDSSLGVASSFESYSFSSVLLSSLTGSGSSFFSSSFVSSGEPSGAGSPLSFFFSSSFLAAAAFFFASFDSLSASASLF